MQINELRAEGLSREFQVVVPARDIETKVVTRLEQLGKTLKLPGFRPGKIPLPVLKQRYRGSVLNEVLQQVVTDSSRAALDSKGLKAAMEPKLSMENYQDGKDLAYKMEVDILPEIAQPDYSKLAITKLVAEPGDAAIDETLERLAKSNRSVEKVERNAQLGDAVLIDFDGSVDGVARDGMKGTDYQLELGSKSFIDSFEDQLVGCKAGDDKLVKVTFPDDYGAKDLAGKAAEFKVAVKEVRAFIAPAIDDSLATKLGRKDLADLKDIIRQQISREYENLSRQRAKRVLLDELHSMVNFELPPRMVEMEFDNIWRQVKSELEQGAEIDEGKSEEQLQLDYRKIAERRVKLGLLFAEIGRQNNITVGDDELGRAIVAEAQRYPGQERQVIEFYRRNPRMLEAVKAPIFEDKVVDFLFGKITINQAPTSIEELSKDPDPVF